MAQGWPRSLPWPSVGEFGEKHLLLVTGGQGDTWEWVFQGHVSGVFEVLLESADLVVKNGMSLLVRERQLRREEAEGRPL